ncbi:efflux RND transporter permease subunit, partial [Wenyingzhuangia sp. 1_MG-2023]|nr:efflux RND transporter permease subunit [Wenyingzhuangia sp. 1_MG-2023]
AHISTGVTENPTHLENYRGAPSLRLGIAFTDNVNVIEVGERVRAKLAELDANRPLGMSLNAIYDQPAEVDASSQNFVLNLVLSIAIVIAVLLLFMGVRAGLIIGAILLLTILGTFIIMESLGIDLHRV